LNGDFGKQITYLKVDVEGSELKSISQWIDSGVLDYVRQVSISSMFYLRIFCTKFLAPKFPTQKPASWFLAPKFCMKNARVKRWWNWLQIGIEIHTAQDFVPQPQVAPVLLELMDNTQKLHNMGFRLISSTNNGCSSKESDLEHRYNPFFELVFYKP
jgi:hypothetical protein